jgi:UPF0755 protein
MKIDRGNLRVLGALITVALIIGAIHTVRPGVSFAPDYPCSSKGSKEVSISVASGATGSSIAQSLFEAGVVKSSTVFFRVAVADSRSQSIAPGVHLLNKQICAKEALNQLLDSARITNLLSIIEGSWISEIKARLIQIGYSKSEVSSAFSSATLPSGYSSLEGLLFPAQYSFDTSTTVSEIVSSMIKRGQSEIRAAGIATKKDKFFPQQLLIIASLIQAEGDQKDFSKISQVVRNRLRIGMPLQFDSTVHYIKGSRGSVFLSTQSTYLKSPFNTYRHYGLPPAPINNPGSQAMTAAAHPEQGDWLYFITVAPGDTRFTASNDEFNTWKVLYKKNLRAGLFRSKK